MFTGDSIDDAAMLDRLLHHPAVLAIDGDSYGMPAHRDVDAIRRAIAPTGGSA